MKTAFTCNMNALGDEQRGRYKTILGKLNQARQEARELRDGYAFRFEAESELIKDAAEFVTYERLCCPFFDFELAIRRKDNALWLRLRGEDESIKEFIRAEFKFD